MKHPKDGRKWILPVISIALLMVEYVETEFRLSYDWAMNRATHAATHLLHNNDIDTEVSSSQWGIKKS